MKAMILSILLVLCAVAVAAAESWTFVSVGRMDQGEILAPQLQQVFGLPSEEFCNELRAALSAVGFGASECWKMGAAGGGGGADSSATQEPWLLPSNVLSPKR